jgi:glycosyltransferase involved in cell wall biosynthesis
MAESLPLVSIILPTYNRAKLLPRALESILSQDFDNFEILLVDDGSTDETSEVVNSIHDKRLRYIHYEENRGIGATRNEGVAQSKGDLIAFIDSDDFWMPGKLNYIVDIYQEYPQIDVLFSNYLNINQINGIKVDGFFQHRSEFSKLKLSALDYDLWLIENGLPESLLSNNIIGTPSIVVLRRYVFQKVGNFSLNLGGTEDFEFWWRAAVKGINIAYTTRIFVERYKDQDSISSQKINFGLHYLQALNTCQQTAIEYNHLDLIQYLNHARHVTWCGLVYNYALSGNRSEALNAFIQSLKFGSSTTAWLYLLAALAGPKTIHMVKLLRIKFGLRQI